jgi:hypothetical protein
MEGQRQQELNNRFSAFNLRIKEIAQDGNCLFRAISDQLYGSEESHIQVRRETLDYIETERNYFQSFIVNEPFDRYLERMRKDKEWGDNVELQAISEIYKARIEIFYASEIPIVIFSSQTKAERIFRIFYKNMNHYDSIVEANGGEGTSLEALIKSMKEKMKLLDQLISRKTSKSTTGLTITQIVERSLKSLEKDEMAHISKATQESELDLINEEIVKISLMDSQKDTPVPRSDQINYEVYQQLIGLGFPMEVALKAQLNFQTRTNAVDIDEILNYVYQNIIH